MRGILKIGQIIRTKSGKKIVVEKRLGAGGQGEVYAVDIAGRKKALKWYYSHTGTENQKTAILKIIKYGRPNSKFLWPQELIESFGIKVFGYIMDIRPRNYSNIVDLMKRRIEPSFLSVVTACIQLTDSFYDLHKMGLCYSDISFGNVFFDPTDGNILICDNDNVTLDKENVAGVLGTPRFMAPEIVIGSSTPNIQSDLFSLAVLLFYMLVMHHPLEGKVEASIKCFDLPAMTRLYGKDPVFIYDPMNISNRPLRGIHDNAIAFWPIYPEKLRGMFIKAFTNGMKSGLHRIGECQWRAELVKLRNSLMYCDCGMENFYDLVKVRTIDNCSRCWCCGKELSLPSRMRIGQEIVMLNPDTKLFSYHIKANGKHDFRHIVGKVVKHPTMENVFGIMNLSNTPWQANTAGAMRKVIGQGKSISIETGTILDFGDKVGEIRKG